MDQSERWLVVATRDATRREWYEARAAGVLPVEWT